MNLYRILYAHEEKNYLDGTLRTGDMDIVYNVSDLEKILKEWHFELGSALRSYYNEDWA